MTLSLFLVVVGFCLGPMAEAHDLHPSSQGSAKIQHCSERLVPQAGEDFDSFLNRRFNGLTPIPAQGELSFVHPATKKRLTVFFGRISDLNPKYREVITAIKQYSLAHPDMPFREINGGEPDLVSP